MPATLLRDRSGMALILTLLAVSFLVAITVRLSTSVNQQMQAAANQSTAVRLDAMLLSGLILPVQPCWLTRRVPKIPLALNSIVNLTAGGPLILPCSANSFPVRWRSPSPTYLDVYRPMLWFGQTKKNKNGKKNKKRATKKKTWKSSSEAFGNASYSLKT
ncbi:hypothetical protein H206_00719 [Candidatus Electrothrix aarhusensis]|uniref:Uncharacterized protein n=1 Tax=Candidatus Electrothrix aarhusensis TaxID=1859131 RepID=A0A444IYS9_9BACT|nr:hypothetical protein H206_00719 [Candidatus Electrothrix aarhusensis]